MDRRHSSLEATASAVSSCRGTHHDLKDLVLAEARCPRRGDIFVGDLMGVLGDLVDQRAQRLSSPALSNAARRWACNALLSPSRIRSTDAVRACAISDIVTSPGRQAHDVASGLGRLGAFVERSVRPRSIWKFSVECLPILDTAA